MGSGVIHTEIQFWLESTRIEMSSNEDIAFELDYPISITPIKASRTEGRQLVYLANRTCNNYSSAPSVMIASSLPRAFSLNHRSSFDRQSLLSLDSAKE